MLAPDERLYGEDGDVRLQDLYNQKPVCLFFWAVWSDDSLKNLALLEEMYQKYGADVTFVAVLPVPMLTRGQPTAARKATGSPSMAVTANFFVTTASRRAAGHLHRPGRPDELSLSRRPDRAPNGGRIGKDKIIKKTCQEDENTVYYTSRMKLALYGRLAQLVRVSR